MRLTALLIVLLFSASGCLTGGGGTISADFEGTWRLYDATEIKAAQNGDSFSREAALKKMVQEGKLLIIFEDGKYTSFENKAVYTTGNWKYITAQNALRLSPNETAETTTPVKFEKTTSGKKTLTLYREKENIALQFIKEAVLTEQQTDDPFHSSNNQWRLKPAQAEDSAQLSERLLNYIRHLALVLKAAKDRKQAIVSFEYSMGPVKIYDGGIGVHPFELLPDYWKNAFYNEGDARRAYRMYESHLQKSSYRGASSGSWVEDDYNILLSLYAQITEGEKKP